MAPSMCTLAITTLLSVALFLGIFFTIVYPEIPESLYVPTQCVPVRGVVRASNCCTQECSESCAVEDDAAPGSPECGAMVASANASPVGNLSYPSGSECTGGSKCCRSACLLCCDGKTVCQACSCFCVLSTPALRCALKCDICYTAVVGIEYATHAGVISAGEHERAFGSNLTALQEWAAVKTEPCYYDYWRPEVYSFDVSFETWTVIDLSLFAVAPVYLNLVLISWVMWPSLHVESRVPALFGVWVGLVPFVVLLSLWAAFFIQECLYSGLALLIVGCLGAEYLRRRPLPSCACCEVPEEEESRDSISASPQPFADDGDGEDKASSRAGVGSSMA